LSQTYFDPVAGVHFGEAGEAGEDLAESVDLVGVVPEGVLVNGAEELTDLLEYVGVVDPPLAGRAGGTRDVVEEVRSGH
jgi:hypothetical protein